jgi:hypothetical protein
MHTRSARSRGVAAIVASLALLGSGAAITGTPAQSVPPAEDCAEALPVADVTKGMAVDGLTVTEGTEPESFSGEVLGVLSDGIAPGVDMILADMTSTEIDRVGIWQGMSGSPVYDADGNLLGAVAYGMSWGPSSVAGITPYEQMDDYLPAEAAPEVRVPAGVARTIAARTDVTARQASEGLERLRVPLTINGISQQRLNKVRDAERGDYLHGRGRAGTLVGAAAGAAADPSSIKDGGNLGAALSYGTITAGGVGTVTDRCGDQVVGFGHPMMFSGPTSLGLMPADALYIQEDSLGAGYKVANLASPAGTITQDRLTGITGAVGEPPSEVDIESNVTYGSRARDGLSHSLSQDWNADVTLMQVLSLHDVTIDAIQPGSETAGVTITGTSAGEEFTLASEDRYVSDFDIAFEGLWSLADLVYIVSGLDDVQITSISTDAEVTDSTDTLRIGKVQQRRGGKWTTVNRRNPARTSGGGLLVLRVELKGPDGAQWLAQQVRVPAKAKRTGRLQVVGGSWTWNDALFGADSVEQVQKALAGDVRNDEVQTRLDFWAGRDNVSKRVTSEPQDLVVRGHRSASVVVRH